MGVSVKYRVGVGSGSGGKRVTTQVSKRFTNLMDVTKPSGFSRMFWTAELVLSMDYRGHAPPPIIATAIAIAIAIATAI